MLYEPDLRGVVQRLSLLDSLFSETRNGILRRAHNSEVKQQAADHKPCPSSTSFAMDNNYMFGVCKQVLFHITTKIFNYMQESWIVIFECKLSAFALAKHFWLVPTAETNAKYNLKMDFVQGDTVKSSHWY